MGDIAAILKVATPSTANATSYASGSYTPAANRLLLAVVSASRGGSNNPDTPTLAGNGLAWDHVQDPVTLADANNLFQSTSTLRDRLCVFFALTGATPSVGALTATFANACTGCNIIVVEIDLADLADPFVQMRMVAVGAAGATVSLDAFEDADNAVFSCFAVDANATIVGEHPELADITYATPARETMAQFLDVADTSPSVTWTGANTAGGIAIELRQASGGIIEAITAAVETAVAQTLGRLKRLILPVAAEADTAAELGKAKRVVIAPATTVATVATLAARKTLALPAAAEADTAGTLAVVQEGEQVVAIDAAVETAEVAALGTAKRLGLVAAPETDAAAALAIAKRVAIAAAAETALAQALARRKTIALAPALEADAAQTLGAPKMLTITPAVETDVALVLALAGEVVPLELLRAYVTLIRAAARARVVRASAPVAIIPTRGDVRVHA